MDSTMQNSPLTVAAILRYAVSVHGDRTVTTATGDGFRHATYREVGQQAARLANALRRLGIDGDQRVATFMWNNQEHLEAYVAVPSMGGYSPSKFAMRAASDCLRAELALQGTTLHALIVGSVDTRMAAHVTWQAKASPRDIGKAGLLAVKHNIDEHDTDPHAVSVRAFLARDPATLKASMAAGLANPDGRRA